jgi:hypothetical protein
MRILMVHLLRQFFHPLSGGVRVLADATSEAFKSRATLHLENLALRQQLGVKEKNGVRRTFNLTTLS